MKTLPSLKNLKKPSCSIFSAIFLFGCGLTSPKIQPHGISSLSSSSSDFDPRIGEAYDQVTDQFLGSSCVSFPSEIGASVEFIPPKIGELNIDQDASFESLSKALSGGGQISLNLDSFKGSGSLEFANEMQSDSYSKTLAVYFNVEQGELALKQQEGLVNLNSLGKNWITSNDETQRRKKCGTVFVGRKKLAANFVAVLKFEFANKGRRDSFAGNVNINVSGFEGEAKIKSAIAAASSDAKITLKVRQIGGDATKLTTLASENIAKCSTSDRAACDSAVKSIFDYVKDFSKQFADTDGKPLPERYMTVANDYRSYDSVDAQWTGKPLSPEEAAKLELDRRAFGEKMSDELANYNRASGLVDSGMSLSALELQDIRAIQDIIRNRFQVYADAAQTCYTETWATCAAANKNADSDIKNNPELAYDITKLVIIPADMIGWCAKLNQYGKVLALDPGALAVANTILNPNEVYTMSKIFTVLIPTMPFSTDPKSEADAKLTNIIGKLDCSIIDFATRTQLASAVVFSQMSLSNVDAFSSLAYTQSLDLSQNFITDALPLGKIRFLENLNLSSNRIQSIEGLASTYISSLNLTNNGLSSPVLSLGKLGTANKVLRQISGIPTLEKLNLSKNKYLTNLEALTQLPSLTDIDLSDTGLDLASFKEFMDRRSTDFPSLKNISFSSKKLDCAVIQSQFDTITCQ